MANTLNLAAIFKSDAEELLRSREEAIRIHGTNIRQQETKSSKQCATT